MSETTETRALNFFTPWRFGVLLALLIVATFPQVILGLQTFVVRDYGFFSYPNAFFQRECFWRGELPFWNPFNECGVPFLAQWNTMPLYPPALIYLLLPLQWSLSFFCLLHLWFAGMGMFFLARRWTENNFAAAFAGMVFSFNGVALNLLMWPSHIATLSWMPWVVLAVESAWREGGRKIFLAAIVGALQMLAGGPETIFLTWLLLAALWIRDFVKSNAPRTKMIFRFPAVIFFVIALAAAQLLPFLNLASHSQRQSGYADLHWSMPLHGLANFLVPMAFGNTADMGVFFQHGQSWTSSYYFGIAALWLALLVTWRRPRVPLFAVATIATLICALGENTFVYPALLKIFPFLSLMTYPVKYVLLLAFLTPLLAAFALTNIQKNQNTARILLIGSILLALIVAILFWMARSPMPGDETRAATINGLTRIIFLLFAGALLLAMTKTKSIFKKIAPLFLILVAWLDVVTHEPAQNPAVSPSIYTSGLAREKLAMQPQPEPGRSRVMPTPASVFKFVHTAISSPQDNFLVARMGCEADCNLLDAIPKVDGFYSLIPRDWAEVRPLLYDDPKIILPSLENFLSVSQTTATNDIYQWQSRSNFLPFVTIGQKPVFQDDANILHALAQPDFDAGKIVLLPPDAKSFVSATSQSDARILNFEFENNRVKIEADASAPALIVVAQTYFHNWRALVDGAPTPLLRANEAFQAVQIPAGRHQIELRYEDRAFQTGAVISVAALGLCLIAPIFCRKKIS